MPSQGVIVADEALGREIKQLRADLRDDLTEIKSQLAGLLPREVYDAKHEALKERVKSLELKADVAEDRQTATRRWLISAVVLPLVAIAVTIILNVT
jgi:hypothetical protein